VPRGDSEPSSHDGKVDEHEAGPSSQPALDGSGRAAMGVAAVGTGSGLAGKGSRTLSAARASGGIQVGWHSRLLIELAGANG